MDADPSLRPQRRALAAFTPAAEAELLTNEDGRRRPAPRDCDPCRNHDERGRQRRLEDTDWPCSQRKITCRERMLPRPTYDAKRRARSDSLHYPSKFLCVHNAAHQRRAARRDPCSLFARGVTRECVRWMRWLDARSLLSLWSYCPRCRAFLEDREVTDHIRLAIQVPDGGDTPDHRVRHGPGGVRPDTANGS